MVFVVVVLAISCATAGGDDDVGAVDAARHNPDAPVSTFPDANMSLIDASFQADAPITPMPDAMLPADATLPGFDAGNGITCSTNNDCTAPGTCCFVTFCVAGTVDPIFGCLPNG